MFLLRRNRAGDYEKIPRTWGISFGVFCLAQQQDQDDQRDRNSNQPEQNGDVIVLPIERGVGDSEQE
jgi:hypothetical protein